MTTGSRSHQAVAVSVEEHKIDELHPAIHLSTECDEDAPLVVRAEVELRAVLEGPPAVRSRQIGQDRLFDQLQGEEPVRS